MRLGLSGQIFEKYSNVKFSENPSSGSRVVPCGRTDGQTRRDEVNSRFLQFCVRAPPPLKKRKPVQRDGRFNEMCNLIGDEGGVGGLLVINSDLSLFT